MKRFLILAVLLGLAGLAIAEFPETITMSGITTPAGANGLYTRAYSVGFNGYYYLHLTAGGTPEYFFYWHDGDLPTDPVGSGWGWRGNSGGGVPNSYIALADGIAQTAMPADTDWVAESGFDLGTLDYNSGEETGVSINIIDVPGNAIQFATDAGTRDLYAVLLRPSDLSTWSLITTDWESDPNWPDCGIGMTEHGNHLGFYVCGFPAQITDGSYYVRILQMQGDTIAQSDTVKAVFPFEWNGSGEITNRTLYHRALQVAVSALGGGCATISSSSTDSVGITGLYPANTTENRWVGYHLIPLSGDDAGKLFPIAASTSGTINFVAGTGTVNQTGASAVIVPKGDTSNKLATMLQETYSGSGDYEFDGPAVRRAKGR